MRKTIVMAVGVAVAGLVTTAGPASAHEPTCAEMLTVEVHGQHVVGDYVMGGGLEWPPAGVVGPAAAEQPGGEYVGGPGPGFHFAKDIPPGASFCNDASSGQAVVRNQVPWN